jgi:23S rRNA (pseudouridine1915-N3)-methyltransferase
MNITVILEGKCRDSYVLSRIGEYQKRLAGQMPLDFVEWGSTNRAKEERFFKSLKPNDRLVSLDAHGKRFDSLAFAENLKKFNESSRSLYLFVGEAEGHSEIVKANVQESWSLTELTMSYEIALLVLAEQIYRAATIIAGHPYHK